MGSEPLLVDAHVHLFPDRLIEAVRAWFDQHAWPIRYRETAEACVARLLAGGVDRMVALPYAHKPGMAQALNDFTLRLAERHPSVVPCCTVFPGEPGEEELLEAALGAAPRAGQGGPAGRTGPFAGIKIHSHVMRVAADDPRLDPVFRASARWSNLPYDWETERRALEALALDAGSRAALFGGTAERLFGISSAGGAPARP